MDVTSSTRLRRERMRRLRRELFGRASRTRRERSMRPNISRIDVDVTELESLAGPTQTSGRNPRGDGLDEGRLVDEEGAGRVVDRLPRVAALARPFHELLRYGPVAAAGLEAAAPPVAPLLRGDGLAARRVLGLELREAFGVPVVEAPAGAVGPAAEGVAAARVRGVDRARVVEGVAGRVVRQRAVVDAVDGPQPALVPAREVVRDLLLLHDLCGFQPLVWGVPTKLQNSLARSNRRRFG